MTARKRIHEILDIAREGDRASRVVDVILVGLIVASITALVLETVPELRADWRWLFVGTEHVAALAFSVEYLLRVYSCTENPRFAHPLWGRLRYMFSFLAVVDLLAVLPYYLPLLSQDLLLLRMFRMFRLVRVLKLGRYSESVALMIRVLRKKAPELMVGIMILLFLLVASSSLMYLVEHEAQPGKFTSIPQAMWWSVATLTTVGYGDVYPVTGLGKLLTAVVAVLGIGLFAIPAGIISSGFVEVMANRRSVDRCQCPRCGHSYTRED